MIPFLKHVPDTTPDVNGYGQYQGSQTYETDDCWIVYVASAFQSDVSYDWDYFDITAFLGQTAGTVSNDQLVQGGHVSLIYLECLRDALEHVENIHPETIPLTVAHEIGHQFGLDHDSAAGFLMSKGISAEVVEPGFSAVHCDLIRRRTNSPGTAD